MYIDSSVMRHKLQFIEYNTRNVLRHKRCVHYDRFRVFSVIEHQKDRALKKTEFSFRSEESDSLRPDELNPGETGLI